MIPVRKYIKNNRDTDLKKAENG